MLMLVDHMLSQIVDVKDAQLVQLSESALCMCGTILARNEMRLRDYEYTWQVFLFKNQ